MDNIISAKRFVVSAVDKAEIFALVEHAQTCDDALDDIGDFARENPGLITSLEHIKEVSDLLEDKFLAEPNNIIPELFEFFRKVTLTVHKSINVFFYVYFFNSFFNSF